MILTIDGVRIVIRKQKRDTMMIRPSRDGCEVFIPLWVNPKSKEVKDFITQGIDKLGRNTLEAHWSRYDDIITPEADIRQMVAYWSEQMGVTVKRLQFRDMTRKWGSCSSRGSVTLNVRLTLVDPELAEYVVVHELAHLIELNHSRAFWAIVEKHMPDWHERKITLDQFRMAVD